MERLAANGLEPRLRGGAAAVARRLCGVQAQDANAARLAVRARTEGLVAADVDADPDVVRTWAWRGTLHLLPREDVAWVLGLVAERSNRSVTSRWRALGLGDGVYARARSAIAERLADGPATRAELRAALAAGGVDASGQRLPHLVRRVALEGLLHHPLDGTFAALDLEGESPSRERALTELGRRYLEGYGPADGRDLAAFCGLAAADARAAWAAVEHRARGAAPREGDGNGNGDACGGAEAHVVRLLGSFDPYLLGYAGRGHAVAPEHARRVWPGGGWIHAVVLVDGMAAGTWRLDGGALRVEPFGAVPRTGLEAEAQDVARFLGRDIAVVLPDGGSEG